VLITIHFLIGISQHKLLRLALTYFFLAAEKGQIQAQFFPYFTFFFAAEKALKHFQFNFQTELEMILIFILNAKG